MTYKKVIIFFKGFYFLLFLLREPDLRVFLLPFRLLPLDFRPRRLFPPLVMVIGFPPLKRLPIVDAAAESLIIYCP